MKKVEKKYIIYKVTSPSGKVYIGLSSKSLEQRIAKHKDTARWVRPDGYFQKAITKYGDRLVWEVLHENLTREEALELEIYYIKLNNSNNPLYGYNCSKGGEYMPDSAALKLRERFTSQEGRDAHASCYGLPKILVTDKDGNILFEYVNKKRLCQELNLDYWQVCLCLKGEKASCGGYYFFYEGTEINPKQLCLKLKKPIFEYYKNDVLVDWDISLRNLSFKYKFNLNTAYAMSSGVIYSTLNYKISKLTGEL
jgi:predicted GIY-YIG superfamily endonuclease